MTADLLRRAATKIRATAQAATPGPWKHRSCDLAECTTCGWVEQPGQEGRDVVADARPADAEHIALWHPGTALTVADLLEHEADEVERGEYSTPRYSEDGYINPHSTVMMLARQILGEAS